jgi:hypothetical protein
MQKFRLTFPALGLDLRIAHIRAKDAGLRLKRVALDSKRLNHG